MDKTVISALTSLQITACFGAFLAYQFGMAGAAPFLTARRGAPSVMLIAIPLIYVANAYLISLWQADPIRKYQGFPAFLGIGQDGPLIWSHWQRLSVFVTLWLPLLAMGYFWIEFHQNSVWANTTPPGPAISPYAFELPFPNALFDWNAHRYGDIGQAGYRGQEFARRSVSFLPGYQPVLMWALSLLCLALAIRLSKTHAALRKHLTQISD